MFGFFATSLAGAPVSICATGIKGLRNDRTSPQVLGMGVAILFVLGGLVYGSIHAVS